MKRRKVHDTTDSERTPRHTKRRVCNAGRSASDCTPKRSRNANSELPVQEGSYLPRKDELVEDENLAILNETIPEQEDENTDNPSLPVRNLDDFVVYNEQSYVMQDFRKGCLGCMASGYVTTHCDDDVDDILSDISSTGDTSDKDQYVRLSKIEEIWMDMEEYEDSKIWIRTAFAWYILQQPSPDYAEYYQGICLAHIFTCLVVTKCYDNTNVTLLEFLSELNEPLLTVELNELYMDTLEYANTVLGRAVTRDDYHRITDQVVENLGVYKITHRSIYKRCSLLKEILGESSSDEGSYSSSDSESSFQERRRRRGRHHISNPEKDVLRHHNETVVTPHVSSIAKDLFPRKLLLAGDKEVGQDGVRILESDCVVHLDNPDSVCWGEPCPGQSGHYTSVVIDGVMYFVGDTVAVKAGENADKVNESNAAKQSAKSRNILANEAWFCIIQYFYEEDEDMYFHGRWFEHGAKTVLAETAHPQELFLTNDCDDNLVSSILQKCEVRRLRGSEVEPAIMDEQDITSNCFYFRHIWDRETMSYKDPDTEDHSIISMDFLEDHNKCYSCALKRLEEYNTNTVKTASELMIFGRKYHCFDFVYVTGRREERDILKVAQIMDLLSGDGTDYLKVRFFDRYEDDTWAKVDKVKERRALEATDQVARVSAERLDGHCHVKAESEINDLRVWVQKDDHFYIRADEDSEEEFRFCTACESASERHDRIEGLIKSRHKLSALDIFSGAGGLTTGMDSSGFVRTQWAIEFSISAARTIKNNHPDIEIYNQDSNLLLRNAIEDYEGKNPAPLRSIDGNKQLPPLPLPGEVDLIMGGPPCQSFSGMNRYKKADDIRHTLICNMISYVEHYRPLQDGQRIVGGVEAGIVKFVMRSLTSLGYQVQINVLNAAEYGSPQARKRVIFWGARLGIPLPCFPIPSHLCVDRKDMTVRSVSSIGHIPVASRSRDPDRRDVHDYAPFWALTVRDAIHDLPGFDWKDPHKIVPRSDEDKEEEAQRSQIYPAFTAHTKLGLVGFVKPEPYRHEPRNPYQAWCRRRNDDTVKDQYSPCLAADVVERTVNVPLEPFACHSHLPRKYRKVNRLDGANFEKAKTTYRRLDNHSQFRTAMTIVKPNAKGATVLHPTQKRVITIRECARAQGFPDDYEFLSINKKPTHIAEDKYRQVGNAVPVSLALALGKALGETMIRHWKDAGFENGENIDYGGYPDSERHTSVDL